MLAQTKTSRPVFLFLLLLGAGLRFYQLDRSLGGGDENQYLLDYGDTALKYIATTYFFGGHPVFHTLLMRLMIMGFGDENAIAIRLPAFVSGVACLWLIYLVARQLFGSLFIARLSLLIAALCPIHVYYSQIARGYSLLMFFSIAMVYAAVKLLDSPGFKWGAVLVLCGALSVYTVPTNVYFAVSLAAWMLASLYRWAEEHKTPGTPAVKKAAIILALFLLMAALTWLAYLPLMGQVMAEASNYHLAHEQETSRLAIAGRVPTGTLSLIFPGALIWFLPLLLAGVLFGNTLKNSYRLLPLCIFFLPLLVPLLSGVSGYPRNYLYNLPLLAIFLAGGIAWAGEFLRQYAPSRLGETALQTTLAAGYAIVSSLILMTDHYPAIKMPDGKLYQQKIRANSQPLDLILIADPKHYLYANSVFKQNLKNISMLGKLSGIKLIASDPFNISDLRLPTGQTQGKIFEDLFSPDNLKSHPLADGKTIFTLASSTAFSILPEDFEANANWRIVSGSGRLSESRLKMAGERSLLLQGEAGNEFVVETVLPNKLALKENSFVVFLWSGKTVDRLGKEEIYIPALAALDENQQKIKFQLILGKVNDGLQTKIRQLSDNGEAVDWPVNAFLGWLPPGEHALIMELPVPPARSVVYDGFRLFVFENPYKMGE